MPTFICHRCRQPLHLPASLSDDHANGGALTQSAYDVIEAESVLLKSPLTRRGHVSRLSSVDDHDNDGIGIAVHARSASDKGEVAAISDSPSEGAENDGEHSGATASNALSSRLALTTSLFDMLSCTTPPSTWVPPSKSPLTPTSQARKVDQQDRRNRARLPLGRNGALSAAIDHPLCAECTNILLALMEGQLEELRRERDAYVAFEEEIKDRESKEDHLDGEDEQTRARKAIDELLVQAQEAQRELQEAQNEASQIEQQVRTLEDEEKKLEEDEKQFWLAYTALSMEASSLSAQRSSLQTSLAHDRAQLNHLELTNVYNDAFSIGYDGGYATINGLRLGRMPNDPRGIEWSEINAAWGQTAFLLVTLARRCSVVLEEYKVNPIGSFSTVEKLGERKEVYELHGSGDWQLGRLLTDRRFDHAMVAFLECLRQLCAAVQQRDDKLKLPHTIVRDKIGGASIRLQFGSDEIWTRALRNVLMTMKVILAWSMNALDEETSPPL